MGLVCILQVPKLVDITYILEALENVAEKQRAEDHNVAPPVSSAAVVSMPGCRKTEFPRFVGSHR